MAATALWLLEGSHTIGINRRIIGAHLGNSNRIHSIWRGALRLLHRKHWLLVLLREQQERARRLAEEEEEKEEEEEEEVISVESS